MKRFLLLPFCVLCFLSCCAAVLAEENSEREASATVSLASVPAVSPNRTEPGLPVKNSHGCVAEELQSNAQSPTWDTPASTTPCGLVETDNLLTVTPVVAGTRQQMITSTARYGLRPHVEVRWGLPGRMIQGGASSRRVAGTTDQWLGACFRFHDQGRWSPDLALDYAVKIPTANPAKGFGSGYVDHLVTFVASRDFGPHHVDFNAVGTIAGSPQGRDGATQFGMAYTRTLHPRFLATLEAFGGPQPGTSDRYGAVLGGGSWSLHPWLAVNGAYTRSFRGGAPRSQYLAGFIYTFRPKRLNM